MTQLYDISSSDYESQERWVLKGPELTNEAWEELWEDVRLTAILSVGKQMNVVYEDRLLAKMIDILVSEKGFEHLVALHNKHFNLAGSKGKTGLLKDVQDNWIPEFYKRLV